MLVNLVRRKLCFELDELTGSRNVFQGRSRRRRSGLAIIEPNTHIGVSGAHLTIPAHLAHIWKGHVHDNRTCSTCWRLLLGMQDLIRRLPGVVSTRVGYTGGEVPNATYRNHGNHAEAIEIIFDPQKTSYRDILEFFFQIHDPSTRNRQGNDIGASYRSAIFYADENQRQTAEDTIADVDASGLWPGKVVTEVVPVSDFWEAEPEHQDYLERIPNGYTCHFARPGWKLPKRQANVA